jgi:hypothetical protein
VWAGSYDGEVIVDGEWTRVCETSATILIADDGSLSGSADCGWTVGTLHFSGVVSDDGEAYGTCSFRVGPSDLEVDIVGGFFDDIFELSWTYSPIDAVTFHGSFLSD